MHRLTLLSVLLLCSLLALPASAQDDSGDVLSRTVAVSGEGTVRVEPDRATVRFGVVTKAPEAEQAREQNATAARQAMNAVRDLGIPESKIRLETLRLRPHYERDPQTGQRRDGGFQAVREVSVEVDSVDIVPTLVARVVQQGANTLQGVQYDLQDRTAARNEALREAVSDAQGKAELLVQALNVSLGRVLQINEQSFNFPRPMMRMDMAVQESSARASPEPDAYAAGEIEVTATVQVVFGLE